MLTPQDWHARFRQQARWTEQVRRFLLDGLGLAQLARGLEVGCGSGVIAAGFQAAGITKIHGIDLKRDFLRLAQGEYPGLRLSQADAVSLPYASNSFDFTFCHFFLLWVPNPLAVLREMRRVTRQGGVVFAAAEPDYGGRIDFPPELARLGRLQSDALRRQGAEPETGRRLGALFQDTGLLNVRSGVLGGQWGAPLAADMIQSEWNVLSTDLAGMVSPGEMAEYRRQDAQAWLAGERILFIPTFYAWGYTA